MLPQTLLAAILKIAMSQGASVFVFGSTLHSENPSDLDLLVIYPDVKKVHDAIGCRREIKKEIRRFGLTPHVHLLSSEEEAEVRFVKNEGCIDLEKLQS